MRFFKNLYSAGRRILFIMFLLIIQGMIIFVSEAQEPPPVPIKVTRNISFGAFTQISGGGTVTVTSGGTRSATNIILLTMAGYPFYSGCVEIAGDKDIAVSIMTNPNIPLTGGGSTLILNINEWSVTFPYIIPDDPPAVSQLYFGGVLSIDGPAVDLPGNYSGAFYITMIQE